MDKEILRNFFLICRILNVKQNDIQCNIVYVNIFNRLDGSHCLLDGFHVKNITMLIVPHILNIFLSFFLAPFIILYSSLEKNP